jgi:hypothetical protein
MTELLSLCALCAIEKVEPGFSQVSMDYGSPKYFDLTADSGQTTRRAFCAACGSPLFGFPGSVPDLVTLRVGSLDDPSEFRPSQDIYTASAQPWDYMNSDLPKVPKMPEL